jgi:hypothetical protein
VTASSGLGNTELETIEPFDLGALRRYDPAVVSGWAAEEATLDRTAGDAAARDEGMAAVKHEIERFLPGDSARLEMFSTDFSQENTDLVLLPIWVFAARYTSGGEERTLRVLVNGQTGEVQGKLPRSWIKIGLFSLAVIAVIGVVALAIAGGLS